MSIDELKPPKGWRVLEVGETIQAGDLVLSECTRVGQRQLERNHGHYFRKLKKGDKPVTTKWLNRHKKISWNLSSLCVMIFWNQPDGRAALHLSASGLTKGIIPLRNRRHLKQWLKACGLPPLEKKRVVKVSVETSAEGKF